MRVLQICHDANGPFIGVCRQYVEAFPEASVCTVFLKGELSKDLVQRVGGGSVEVLDTDDGNLRGFKFSQIIKLIRRFRHDKFDLVVAHRYKSIYLAGIMSYFMDLPVLLGVVHEHDVFRRITRRLFVTFWRSQFLIAGVSNSVTENIASYCPSLVRRKKLKTLPNVLSEHHESTVLSRQEAREALGLPLDATIIGSIGRLVKKKSFPTLLEAFAKAEVDSDVKLVLIGEGPIRAELERIIEAKSLGSRVQLIGHVESASRLVTAFDLFVLTSGHEEAFGLVLLEAMIAKVPVLYSDVPGPAEVVGDSGWCFPSGDAAAAADKIEQFVNSSQDVRLELAQNGYDRAKSQFSSQNFRAELTEFVNR